MPKGAMKAALLLAALLLAGYAAAAPDASCDLKDFPELFSYGEAKNRNLATALYSISAAFKEKDVAMTRELLAAVMATLAKEVGGDAFLPVEENGDYGMGDSCAYRIGGNCRSSPYGGGADYKGRGYIQITHKENYAKYCGPECVGTSAPELDVCGCKHQKRCTQTDESICPQVIALRPEYAGRIFAAYYLGTRSDGSNLVQLAQNSEYRTVGKKINGGSGYADDFSGKAGDFLQLFESRRVQTRQLLGCLDVSSDYCTENGLCGPGKECDLSTHTCEQKQPPTVPAPEGCESGYLFSCNDRVSTAIQRYLPIVFRVIVRNCQDGYLYGSDRRCHPECGSGTYCGGDSECYNGQCLSCDSGHALGEDGLCYPERASTCEAGYLLGEDERCHPECGSREYCIGDAVCLGGECLSCDPGYYLGTDGLCYPYNGGEDDACPTGYVYGDDELCHPECGSGTYCADGAVCYDGACLSCDGGHYLGTDGLCYPDDGDGSSCPVGYVPGEDGLCHLECGSETYCVGGSECYNGACLICDPGNYLGTDGMCYPERTCDDGYLLGNDDLCYPECGSETYCAGDSLCFDGECLSCDGGYYLGTDGMCYPEDGGAGSCAAGYIPGDDGLCHLECGSGTYCIGDSFCYNGECLSCDPGYYLGSDGNCYPEGDCDYGYILGDDGLCHKECGISDTYCTGDSQCFFGRCLSCDPGYYLGTDGSCYPENGGSSCNSGYILGNDDLCHRECGSSGTYCTGDAQCLNGRCLSCDYGYYLGTDGNCYPEGGGSSCNSGYILGNDDLCHPECGNSGTYCTGDSQCLNGRCLSCDPGYYLGTDGNCYPENGGSSCNSGYILGNDDLCHPECGNSGTYCIGGSICYYGRCLSCDPGYYLGTDGNCYPY